MKINKTNNKKIENYCTVTETYYKHWNVESQYQLQYHTHCTSSEMVLTCEAAENTHWQYDLLYKTGY